MLIYSVSANESHDRTLLDIAQKMPMTLAELEDVHGLGPAKIMKYGEEILKVVSC
ncbi:MAG: HRDC domain-containing protein [Nanoarchaeota archaeon]|nr:HRDC domain-containing protein [Nanoarchaeota archaeon]